MVVLSEEAEFEMYAMSSPQDRMAADLADLKNDMFELNTPNRIVPLICEDMRLRAGRIVIGAPPSEVSIEFEDAIHDAFENGAISDPEYARIVSADMIISAVCRDSQSRAYVAVEASIVVDAIDISEARESAEILAKAFPNAKTRSAAYGRTINPEGRSEAEKLGVSIYRAQRHPRRHPQEAPL